MSGGVVPVDASRWEAVGRRANPPPPTHHTHTHSASNDKHQAKAVGAFSFSFPLLRNKNPETGRPAGKQFMSHKHNGNRVRGRRRR